MINNWDQSFPADTIKSIATIKLDHNFTGNKQAVGLLLPLLGTALQRIGWPADSRHEGAALRDVDPHDTRDVRLDHVADDVAEHPRRLRAPLESGLRIARGARVRSGRGPWPRRRGGRRRLPGHRRHVHPDRRRHVGRDRRCRQPARDEEAAGARQHHALAQHAHLQSRLRVAQRHLQQSPDSRLARRLHLHAQQTTLPSTQRAESRRRRRRVAVRELPARHGEQRVGVESHRSELAQACGLGIRAGHVAGEVGVDDRLRSAVGSTGLRLRGRGSPQHVFARRGRIPRPAVCSARRSTKATGRAPAIAAS